MGFLKKGSLNMGMTQVIDMAATGRNITRLREKAGLSVKELQDVFGFRTPQAIYKWQHGAALPSIDNMVILASALSVTIDDIIIVNDIQLELCA